MSKDHKEINFEISREEHETTTSSLRLKVEQPRMAGRRMSVEENSDDISSESENLCCTSETVAFWILGLCSQFWYSFLATAGPDILDSNMYIQNKDNLLDLLKSKNFDINKDNNIVKRDCNKESIGSFLVISVIPELVVQIISPFSPMSVHLRMVLVVSLSLFGICTAASSSSPYIFYLGVGFAAISTGLSKSTLLMYMSTFNNMNLIKSWASGTGGAGLFGSLFYLCLVTLGIHYSTMMYTLAIIPIVMAGTFWGILNFSLISSCIQNIRHISRTCVISKIYKPKFIFEYLHHVKRAFTRNIFFIPHLYPYLITAGLLNLFDLYISQCLYQLIYFKNFTLTNNEQYYWYIITYNFADFLVKNSLNFITINSIWCLPFLQGMNAAFLTLAAIYSIIPHFSFVLCFIFLEGLFAAYMYTTVFFTLYTEVDPEIRKFSLAFVTVALSMGQITAGIVAGPAHRTICNLPANLSMWHLI